jgi:hypothetical protein
MSFFSKKKRCKRSKGLFACQRNLSGGMGYNDRFETSTTQERRKVTTPIPLPERSTLSTGAPRLSPGVNRAEGLRLEITKAHHHDLLALRVSEGIEGPMCRSSSLPSRQTKCSP